MELKIEYVPIGSISEYENNAKLHPERQVEQIKKSIQDYGMNDPIAVWHNEIVEGHGRLMACKELGFDTVPIIRLDDLTDAQRREYMLVHNKTTMNSDFDFAALEIELGELTEFDADFYEFELEPEDEEIEDPEVFEDEEPDEVETRCKPGDVWQLGDHRLICGDSTDVNVIDKLMDGAKAKLLLTDPPYGIDVVKGNKVGGDKAFGKAGGRNIIKSKTYSAIIGDDTTDTARANYDVALTCTENQIIFGGNYFTDFLPPSRCWIVWDKQNTGNFADAELAWTSFDKGVRLYHFLWNGLCREGSREVEGIRHKSPLVCLQTY